MINQFRIQIQAEHLDNTKTAVGFIVPWQEVKEANFDLLTHMIRERILALANELENP